MTCSIKLIVELNSNLKTKQPPKHGRNNKKTNKIHSPKLQQPKTRMASLQTNPLFISLILFQSPPHSHHHTHPSPLQHAQRNQPSLSTHHFTPFPHFSSSYLIPITPPSRFRLFPFQITQNPFPINPSPSSTLPPPPPFQSPTESSTLRYFVVHGHDSNRC